MRTYQAKPSLHRRSDHYHLVDLEDRTHVHRQSPVVGLACAVEVRAPDRHEADTCCQPDATAHSEPVLRVHPTETATACVRESRHSEDWRDGELMHCYRDHVRASRCETVSHCDLGVGWANAGYGLHRHGAEEGPEGPVPYETGERWPS